MARIAIETTEPNRVGDTYEVTVAGTVTEEVGRRRWEPQANVAVLFLKNKMVEGGPELTDGQGRAVRRFSGLMPGSYEFEVQIKDTAEKAAKPVRVEQVFKKIGKPNFDAEGDDGNWVITGVVPDENGQPLKDYPVLTAITKEGRKEAETVIIKTDSGDGYLRYRLVFTEPECEVRVRVGGYEKLFTLYGPPKHPRPPRYFLIKGEDEGLESSGFIGALRSGWKKGREALAKRAGAPEEEIERQKAAIDKTLEEELNDILDRFIAGELADTEVLPQSNAAKEKCERGKAALERAIEGRGLRHAFKRGMHGIGFSLASNNNWRANLLLVAVFIFLLFGLFVIGFNPTRSTPAELTTEMELYYRTHGIPLPKLPALASEFLRRIRWWYWFLWIWWLAGGILYKLFSYRDEVSRAWRATTKRFREERGSEATPPPAPATTPQQTTSSQAPAVIVAAREQQGSWLSWLGRDFWGSFLANLLTHRKR